MYKFKIIIIGDPYVGKSYIISRFKISTIDYSYVPTIGIDFATKNITIDDTEIKINLWDTAGQEIFKSITRTYYNNIAGAIIVYYVSRRQTFDNVKNWLKEIERNITSLEMPTIMLIGNKTDLQRKVTTEEGENFAKNHNMLFFESSRLNDMSFFQTFFEKIYERREQFSHGITGIRVLIPPKKTKKCC